MFSTLDLPRGDELGRALAEPAELAPPAIRTRVAGLSVLTIVIAAIVAWTAHLAGRADLVPIVAGAAVGLILLAGVLALWRRRRLTFTLRLFERGVAVTQGKRTRSLLFEELDEVSLRDARSYLQGNYQGQQRRLVLRDRATRVVVEHRTHEGLDPFGPWLYAFLHSAGPIFERRLASGFVLRGDGWSFETATGLTVGQRSIDVSAIASAVAADDRLSVWTTGEEQPILSVPEGSSNATLLLGILLRRLGDREVEVPGRGRLLYEHRPRRLMPSVAILAGLGMLVGGLAVFDKADAGAAPYVLLLLGATTVALASNAFVQRFTAYERLLERRTLLGTRTLAMAELDGLDFEQTRVYVNGVYTGTTVKLEARSSAGKPLTASMNVLGGSENLDALRDTLAERVAERLEARLRLGESVVLGRKELTLTPEGVVYQPKGLFFKKAEEARVPYCQSMTFVMNAGECNLSVAGSAKPFVTIPAGGRDFYPGMLVLGRRAAAAQESAGT